MDSLPKESDDFIKKINAAKNENDLVQLDKELTEKKNN